MAIATIKSSHKHIQVYYAQLKVFDAQGVGHESALRMAFQNLLAETARPHHWTLIPELSMRVGGKTIRPDGTLCDDAWQLHRGYWEAKDTDDDLDLEIRKKTDRGYPLFNTIFEDTQHGVLYQNEKECYRAKLSDATELADLLNRFYDHTPRDYRGFEQAADDFKERVPRLAAGLLEKIRQAHESNAEFESAFDSFHRLCRQSLNPKISSDAVDEMIVQHLLTERIFDKVFRDQDFVRRNVIAVAIERIVAALISRSFNRGDFLGSLEPLYQAIERAADNIDDFGEKQHFLNAVYERFFHGYSMRLADTHGIKYTPQQIVSFMCDAVDQVLASEFGLSLGSPGVFIIDPCTGTGNFAVNLLRRIQGRDLSRVYREQLFANEIMLLPYYIASQNIEREYYERSGGYEPFSGLCFVDTLGLAESEQSELSFMTEENAARVKRQRRTPVTVVIGNPPYNMGQANENDNNRNRRYEVLDRRVSMTYAKSSKATLKKQLYDPYVKFFRWATDRLQGRDGIVCYVSNNSFVDQVAFDGMREHLIEDFHNIYHIDMHGNVRRNPKLSGSTHNVFGIQVGVGITIAVRNSKRKTLGGVLRYHRVPENWRREEKLGWLASIRSLEEIDWVVSVPNSAADWSARPGDAGPTNGLPIGSKESKAATAPVRGVIFSTYGRGVATNCDKYVYDFDRAALSRRAEDMVEDFNAQRDRWRRKGCPKDLEGFLVVDESRHKWIRNTKRTLLRGNGVEFSNENIRKAIYRPFTATNYYFERTFNEDTYRMPTFFPTEEAEGENVAIVVSDIGYRADSFSALASRNLVDLHVCATTDSHQCFPFYVYDKDGSGREENITDWALGEFRNRYSETAISKWDLFYYIYGVLHVPSYRTRFATSLKRDLPRIPFPDRHGLWGSGRRYPARDADTSRFCSQFS